MEKIERKLPIGKAKKLEATKETLPTVEVKNHVLWVNPAFHELPFKLEEGKQANLGLFLNKKGNWLEFLLSRFKKGSPENKGVPLETMTGHGRSAILGRLLFQDKEGRIYRDVDLKGMGHVRDSNILGGVYPREGRESYGILDLAAAYHDKEISEIFLEKGIGTHRVIAIIKLEEMVKRGKKISVEEAKRNGSISELVNPVIEVRAYGTKFRLQDLGSKNGKLLLEDARILAAQKSGKGPDDFDNLAYLKWLAKTIAENIGLMHEYGWYHGYLTIHNIALDGSLVDFDSVTHVGDRLDRPDLFQKDLSETEKSLISVSRDAGYWDYSVDLLKEFNRAYEKIRYG